MKWSRTKALIKHTVCMDHGPIIDVRKSGTDQSVPSHERDCKELFYFHKV